MREIALDYLKIWQLLAGGAVVLATAGAVMALAVAFARFA